jgi:hypothetical protein
MAMKSDPKMKRLAAQAEEQDKDEADAPESDEAPDSDAPDTDAPNTSAETPYAREKARSERPGPLSSDDDEDSDDEDSGEEEAGEAAKAATSEKVPRDARRSSSGGPPPARAARDSTPAAKRDSTPAAKRDSTPVARAARRDELAPYVVPAYVAGLLLLLIGERIVPGDDVLRYAFSGLGVAAMLGSTLYRLRAVAGAGSERRSVERILALLMAGGVLAIAIYFTSTDTGKSLLGIASLKAETRARVSGVTLVAWVVLLVGSVTPLVFGEIAFAPMRRAERIEARRVRAATLGGATLAFAATYVALFAYAAGELDQKLDFSYYRTSRPGESTKNIVKSFTEPVEVIAFFPALNEVGAEVKGYLDELAQASPQIQVRFQDRLLVPAMAKEMKVSQDGVLVLKRGDSRETVTLTAEMKNAQSKLKTLDADFQKALYKVMRPARTAYLTVGHGELNELTGADAAEGRSAKNIKRLIESQNYLVKDLGVVQGLGSEIPQDATMVLVLGPSKALAPEEIAALKRYAERGGKLVLALDPDGKVDHSPLAAAVGLSYKPVLLATEQPRLVARRNESDRLILATNRFSSHASVSSLSKNSQRAAVVFRGAAALDKAEGATQNVDFAVKALADTFDDQNGNFAFDKDTEKKSSYNLAAAISAPAPGEKDKDGKDKEMRAVVFGDADALSDAVIAPDSPFSNVLMLLDVVRWLGGDESFVGSITSNEDVKIEHTKQKDAVWFYGTIFAVPLGVIGLGFIATRRSRRRRAA